MLLFYYVLIVVASVELTQMSTLVNHVLMQRDIFKAALDNPVIQLCCCLFSSNMSFHHILLTGRDTDNQFEQIKE